MTVWREEHVKGRLHPGGVDLQPQHHLHTAAHRFITHWHQSCVCALCVRSCVHPTAVDIQASLVTVARRATSSLNSAWMNTPERGPRGQGGRGGLRGRPDTREGGQRRKKRVRKHTDRERGNTVGRKGKGRIKDTEEGNEEGGNRKEGDGGLGGSRR